MKILGIGAHYDDSIFGIPGVLLRAVDQGHKVTILSVIGDYGNWSPVGEERQSDMIDRIQSLFEKKGIVLRFLDYQSMAIEENEASKRALAEVVAEVEPDVGFMLWPSDSHPDHEVVSELSNIAFNWAGTVLGESSRVKGPRRYYYYDNGPRHTFGFEPDTFVDQEFCFGNCTGKHRDANSRSGRDMEIDCGGFAADFCCGLLYQLVDRSFAGVKK
jgi:LmbE family N-acetylglucosaminyl deacetylase